jgi:hypothetical protein
MYNWQKFHSCGDVTSGDVTIAAEKSWKITAYARRSRPLIRDDVTSFLPNSFEGLPMYLSRMTSKGMLGIYSDLDSSWVDYLLFYPPQEIFTYMQTSP